MPWGPAGARSSACTTLSPPSSWCCNENLRVPGQTGPLGCTLSLHGGWRPLPQAASGRTVAIPQDEGHACGSWATQEASRVGQHMKRFCCAPHVTGPAASAFSRPRPLQAPRLPEGPVTTEQWFPPPATRVEPRLASALVPGPTLVFFSGKHSARPGRCRGPGMAGCGGAGWPGPSGEHSVRALCLL